MTTSLGETASDEFGYKAWSEARKRGAEAFELASAAQYKEASAMLCDAILSGYANALEEIRLDLLADTVHDCIKHAAGQLATRVSYAFFLAASNAREAAVELTQAVTALDDGAASETDGRTKQRASLLRMRGWLHSMSERWADALTDLNGALEANDCDPIALHLRAKVYAATKRQAEYVADLERYIEVAAQDVAGLATVHYELIVAFPRLKRGTPAEALPRLEALFARAQAIEEAQRQVYGDALQGSSSELLRDAAQRMLETIRSVVAKTKTKT